MKQLVRLLCSLILLLSNASVLLAVEGASSGVPPTSLTQAEIEKLVQPIALYPDLLLQQVLAASTFPEQILDVALYHEQGKPPEDIKKQPWDDSVKGIANYPSIVTMLASDLDWTLTLASVFVNQSLELKNAIQTLRARAKTVGNLKSSEQQNVIEESGPNGTTIIRVEPTQPQVIYVPTTTTVVYEEPVSSSSLWVPLASFGVGMALGYAMGDDDDDDHYYYGGGGIYGPSFWHRDDCVNDWVDHRRDRWNDSYEFARDRQEWRQDDINDRREWNQDNRNDWREHRQDLDKQQQDWRAEAKNRAGSMSPEQRAEAATKAKNSERANQARQNAASRSGGSFSKTGTANYGNTDRSSANARIQQAKSNPQVQQRAQNYKSSPQAQQRAQSYKNNPHAQQRAQQARSNSSYDRGSGLSGMDSGRRSVSSSQTRGSSSRARAGGGGRSYGGGGRRR